MNAVDPLVSPAWLDLPDSPVLTAPPDPKDSLDKMVHPDNVDLKDPPDPKDLPVKLDPKESLVLTDSLGNKDLKDLQETAGNRETREIWERLEIAQNL